MSRWKRWRGCSKEKKRESRLLGADFAANGPAKAEVGVNKHAQQQGDRKQQRVLISLQGRGLDCAGSRTPDSPESGELFSDEEAPDAELFLSGFPDDNVADAGCGAMEEVLLGGDWVLQPGDVVQGPDIMSAMWHAAHQADTDAPASD